MPALIFCLRFHRPAAAIAAFTAAAFAASAAYASSVPSHSQPGEFSRHFVSS